ncbi:MAG: peptidoglycan editing factor PgeF [Bacteroidales bacterium]|nr:peptidoglycan editing factor PgeF [Bacteroidales bacterium]
MNLLKYNISDEIIAFSTKRGGGNGNYATFNITHYCGDSEEHVARCREELCRELNISDDKLILPYQTHQTNIVSINENFFSLTNKERIQKLYGVDAVVTNLPQVCIGVSTADCIPILLYDEINKVVAAIHAGWRGTLNYIVVKIIKFLQKEYSSNAQFIKVVICPGISLKSFEVGDEVYKAFSDAGFDMNLIARQQEKWHIDLWEANRIQLLSCGVKSEKIHISGICTYYNYKEFFSARRLGIKSGRIFNGIMLKK